MPISNATQIINHLEANDGFSAWLGIVRLQESEGCCQLQMTIRKEMCNGFGIAHGGICYSLADSALAFASNSRGRHAVSIETSISHLKPLLVGDTIVATAIEKSLTNRIGIYEVQIEKPDGLIVALFKGTVFRKDKEWAIGNGQ